MQLLDFLLPHPLKRAGGASPHHDPTAEATLQIPKGNKKGSSNLSQLQSPTSKEFLL
jgi:hypothetical protein